MKGGSLFFAAVAAVAQDEPADATGAAAVSGIPQRHAGGITKMRQILFPALSALLATMSLAGGVHASAEFLRLGKPWKAPDGFQAVCAKHPVICTRTPKPHALTEADWQKVKEINTRVNKTIRQVSDQRQYHVSEKWALPTHAMGDCEDIALLKKKELIEHGISSEHLLMAVVLDTHDEGHAVLVVRTHAGDFVLDNLTNKIQLWNQTHYFFLEVEDPEDPKRWDMVLQRAG